MSEPSTRHRYRWLIPVGTAALLAGASATFAVAASAETPAPTAAELLAAVQEPAVAALSGTVVTRADLGLPAVPAALADVGPFTLNDESVTAQVWVDGSDMQRITVGSGAQEVSAIRNGDSAWLWSPADNGAVRLIGDRERMTAMTLAEVSGTPAEIAAELLAEVEPTTDVRVAIGTPVADRKVFDLVLTPEDAQTLVGQIVVSVDAETSVPLQVAVFSKTSAEPAFESGFTSVDYIRPDADTFEFTPPADAEVTERYVSATDKADQEGKSPIDVEVIGDGWSAVAVGSVDLSALAERATNMADTADPQVRQGATEALLTFLTLPTISGDWGSGRVIEGTWFSVIVTDDGRYAIGAVAPETLASALG